MKHHSSVQVKQAFPAVKMQLQQIVSKGRMPSSSPPAAAPLGPAEHQHRHHHQQHEH
jgi:hypothetical protein